MKNSLLFLGFPVDEEQVREVTSSAFYSLYVNSESRYLEEYREGDCLYLGKYIDEITDLDCLARLEANIYSILKKWVPNPSSPLYLMGVYVPRAD